MAARGKCHRTKSSRSANAIAPEMRRMTKYCNGADPLLDAQLQTVIDTVKHSVVGCGYHPQLAAEIKLHSNPVEEYRVPDARP
jgi:hypothetical protein